MKGTIPVGRLHTVKYAYLYANAVAAHNKLVCLTGVTDLMGMETSDLIVIRSSK